MEIAYKPNIWIDHLISLSKEKDNINHVNTSDKEVYHNINSCFKYCSHITAHHSKSFFMASALLPKEKRNAIRSLYSFCRTTDDIVDVGCGKNQNTINHWYQSILSNNPRFNDPVAIAWSSTRRKFKIPSAYATQLVRGVKMDLHKKRYSNFEELAEYCYHVASTVGLMSMHIVGYHSEEAKVYAIKLGIALQLTNILRDIAEDYNKGRIYLPQDELDRFGITKDHIHHKIVDDKWKKFMKFQIQRARKLYDESKPGFELLHNDGRLAIGAAALFYKKILNEIESMNYDIFSSRAYVSKWNKLKKIPSLIIKFKFSISKKVNIA